MPHHLPLRRFLGAALLVSASVLGAQQPAKQPAAKPRADSRQGQALPARGQPVTATKVTSVEGITEYQLPNGMKVLLFPDQSKPTVTVNITYLVGSRHEGYGETGMAHLLEHLVFKGTPKHKDIPSELTQHGARPNGTTWFDRTNYFETVPATEENLTWALDLESDRMVNSYIAKKDLESEFTVVRNELESGETQPFRVTLQRMLGAAYDWHNYGKSTIGARSDVEGVPIERLQAFYRRYYQPDNSILTVAGKFDEAKTLKMIEQRFGAIPKPVRALDRGNMLFPTYTVEPVQDGERQVAIRRVGDAQLLMAGWHVPAGSHADYAAVDVLTRVLGASATGRLYKGLVDTKLAASVGAFNLQLREPGMVVAQANVRMTQSMDSAKAALQAVIAEAAKGPFTAEEVSRGKQQILKELEQVQSSSEATALALSEWASMGDWRLMMIHRDRVETVTPADVQRVAAAYLKPSNMTIAQFIPTQQPDRAEIPATPDVQQIVQGYKGRAVMQAGEVFDAAPAAIEKRLAKATLPSGARVTLLSKKTRNARVVGSMAFRYGTAQSLTNQATAAGVLGTMLSRGTTQLTRAQVRDSLDKMKSQVMITGQPGMVSVRFESTRDKLGPTLQLIAQELRSPAFDSSEFAKAKTEALAQIEQAKSEPQFRAIVALQRKLLPRPAGDPLYTMTAEEQIAALNALTVADVKALHAQQLGASGADIALVGDFDADSVQRALGGLFGDWKNPSAYARVPRPALATDSSTEVIETPDKANAFFVAGLNLPIRDDDPDYPALMLGNWMLGGGFLNSRLATRIRQKEGLSYVVASQLQASSIDKSGNFLGLAIYAPQNAAKLVAAFQDELAKVRTAGFTQDEVNAAKPGLIQQLMQSRANDDQLVGILLNRRFVDRTMAFDAAQEAALQALTAEQVNAAMRKYIDPAKLVVVRAGDFAKGAAAQPAPAKP
ncbi:MAG: M16 family metallopeptidase [Gemmatimonadaceae bacterium]